MWTARRRRAGISSVVGALFFVLISFLVLSSAVLVFSSFNGYSETMKSSDQAAQTQLETSLSIRNVVFGGVVSPLVSNAELQSVQNENNQPLFPVSNMNFTNNMDGWFFTRAYQPVPEDNASVTDVPLNVLGGGSVAFTMTVTNSQSSGNDIAQVSLSVNSDFQVPPAQVAPSGWGVSVSGNAITWTAGLTKGNYNNDINGGNSLQFQWTAVPPGTLGTYPNTVTISWVAGDSPPFTDSGSGTIDVTVVSSNQGSSTSATVSATSVPGAWGANGGYDPSTLVGSESGPGSLGVVFEPTVGGTPLTDGQSLGAMMNFTTSFTLDAPTASEVNSGKFSFGYSLDQFVCKGDPCTLAVSTYLVQESTGKEFLIMQANPLSKNNSPPTGWVTASAPLPAIAWSAGRYDLVVSTSSVLGGSEPGSHNYPAILQMHFDDIGIRLGLSTSSYYVDSWSQYNEFVVQTGTSPLEVSGISLTVSASTTSGPVSMYVYLNDFSTGTMTSPSWVLFNESSFSGSTSVSVSVQGSQSRLFVSPSGTILLRIYAISTSSFVLTAGISSVVKTNDQTHVALTVLNQSPFTVHLVSLYVSGPNGLAHFDQNATGPGVVCFNPPNGCAFSEWLNPGETLTLSLPVDWAPNQTYVVTMATGDGVIASETAQS